MGTIFGSLAAGVVMLFLNYQALGRAKLARTVSIWGSALFISILLIASLTPNTAGFAFLFMGIQAGAAYFLADKLQGQAIAYHQQHAGAIHSNIRAVGVGLIAGIVTVMGLGFVLAVLSALWLLISGDLPATVPVENGAV